MAALLDIHLEQVAQVVVRGRGGAEMALLLHRRGLGVALDHQQPAQHGAVFAGHLLPGRLALVRAEGDRAALDRRRQQDAPAVFRHPHVAELRPALGPDADGGAQIDQALLEALGPHLPSTSRCSRDARSPAPCARADRRSGRRCSGSARRNRPLFRRASSTPARVDRTSAAGRCRNASARPPRPPRSAAGKSSSARRSAGRRCASPSSPDRRSADWPPSRSARRARTLRAPPASAAPRRPSRSRHRRR